MSNKGKCRFCGSISEFDNDSMHDIVYCECPVCGTYMLMPSFHHLLESEYSEESYKVSCYLFYTNTKRIINGIESRIRFLGTKREYDYYFKPGYIHVTLEMIDSWFPRTFNEKIDMILLSIANRTKNYGDSAAILPEEIISCCFINRYQGGKKLDDGFIKQRRDFYIDYLKHHGYLYLSPIITLTAEGWQRVDELQKYQTNNKDVFVSMSFADTTKSIREAIRTGIVNAGFSPDFIDEIIHNKQIVPEMFRLIRECRLLIMDISEPNYGAYYEAGYALGLGKEVIISCSSAVFSKQYTEEEKRYEKYLKPHFDIAQKQILIWDDYDDLTKKLAEWIRALFE